MKKYCVENFKDILKCYIPLSLEEAQTIVSDMEIVKQFVVTNIILPEWLWPSFSHYQDNSKSTYFIKKTCEYFNYIPSTLTLS